MYSNSKGRVIRQQSIEITTPGWVYFPTKNIETALKQDQQYSHREGNTFVIKITPDSGVTEIFYTLGTGNIIKAKMSSEEVGYADLFLFRKMVLRYERIQRMLDSAEKAGFDFRNNTDEFIRLLKENKELSEIIGRREK